MFSYYEFFHPMSQRMTDAAWIDTLRKSNPSMPKWIQDFSARSSQTNFHGSGDDMSVVLFPKDSIPDCFGSEDSVIAFLHSDTIPAITVECRGKSSLFTGAPVDKNRYRVSLPTSSLGDSNILTITVRVQGAASGDCFPPKHVSISYRKILTGNVAEDVIQKKKLESTIAFPRFVGKCLLLSPGSTWRVYDIRGRQVAFINATARQWIPGPHLAHMELFVVPDKKVNGFRPLRIVSVY